MSSRTPTLVASLGALAVLSLACSDGSGPGKDLTNGTFVVDIPLFTAQAVGPCQVPTFQFTIDTDGTGARTMSIPDSMRYACAFLPTEVQLQLITFDKAADSLEAVWTDDLVSSPSTLVIRWKPGTASLYGTATFTPTGTQIPEVQFWTGVRQ